MSKAKGKPRSVVRLKIGDKVRVRRGVRDIDYPDMPLGGWKGKVAEVHKNGMYEVQWSKETLSSIHPVFKQRCEIDGLDEERYGLSGDDLEADTGGPLDIEQPEKITTKPLSPRDQDDRVRMVFGLTSNDLLPDVDYESLEAYHEHLSSHLAFPFTARFRPKYGSSVQITVIGLSDSDKEPVLDSDYGIICEARFDRRVINAPLGDVDDVKGKPNRQLVDDYRYWFHNWC